MNLQTTPGYVPGFRDELSLRDLGGQRALDGRHVRHGLIYRGSALTDLTSQELAALEALDLRLILDLRAQGEVSGKEDVVPAGTEYLRIAGMYDEDGNEQDFSPAGIARIMETIADPSLFMRGLYASMMFGNPAMHALVERLQAGQVPLYFHCSAGKDRTGVCAALVLTMLGVSDADIVKEFLLTNQYRASIINLPPEQMPAWLPVEERETWARRNSVNKDDLLGALAAADARFGSREAYLREEYGLDAAALADLRNRYLE